MAANEAQFCTEFMMDYREQMRGKAVRLNDKFIRGFPDMMTSNIVSGPLLIEAKFARMPKKADTKLPLELSRHQSLWLRDSLLHGLPSCWMLCVKDGRNERLYVG